MTHPQAVCFESHREIRDHACLCAVGYCVLGNVNLQRCLSYVQALVTAPVAKLAFAQTTTALRPR
ncbi:hypothetical protein XAC902_60023 [Xanthomonas citri pv. citri]|nr:hypothetical protein XAC902_60023 [Xanthomonas citri pv. citri]